MQSPSRLPHLVRGSSAAGIATFAALFSHVVGGGAMPGPLGIAVPLLLSLMVCILLAGRKLSLARLSVSVVASQMLFHTLFVLGTPTAGAQMNMSAGHHHGHGMMQMPVVSEQTITLVHGDATMWVSHFIGAAVTVFFLYRGEQAIHRLRALAEQFVAWVRHRLVVPLRLPAATAPARVPVTVETSGWSVLSQLHASTLSRRGPPRVFRIAH
ncbi:hypothetical protein [Leucobacter celer]|uniref:hypothetical protein n=1 Tax=Leucobacter celer TaxID=668625 RepID=UPI0006A7840C|nr:hypothetical protein [Leucobacter celer]